MFDGKKNFSRLNGYQLRELHKKPYDEVIYIITEQLNSEVFNIESEAQTEHEKDISAEDFVEEIFIALRTIYNAKISIDNQNIIEIKFSDNCCFNIQISRA